MERFGHISLVNAGYSLLVSAKGVVWVGIGFSMDAVQWTVGRCARAGLSCKGRDGGWHCGCRVLAVAWCVLVGHVWIVGAGLLLVVGVGDSRVGLVGKAGR